MAECHIAVDVNTEPVKWPIAPDGYIPNSVIRSWRKRGKGITKVDCWDDFYQGHETITEDEEDISTRTLWFVQDEEEEDGKEKTDEVKGRGEQNKDEKKKKQEDKTDVKGEKEGVKTEKEEEITKVKGKGNEDVKKETEEEKVGRPVLLMQSNKIQPEKNLQNQPKTFPDKETNVEPQREEVGSKYSSRNVSLLPASCHEKGPKPLRELKEDKEFSVSSRQRISLSSFAPKEPRITSHLPPTEPQNFTPHPLKPPPPPSPEDPQPQPDRQPPGGLPIKDQSFLLSSAKYNTHQTQVPLDRKVLELFKKRKVNNKNSSYHGKLSTSEKHPPAFTATLSTIETQRPRFTHPESPSHPLASDDLTQSAQTTHSIKDQRGHKPVPKLAATEHLLKSSNAKQLPAAVSTLQPGQAAVHQRVVQKIQMKDTQELASSSFHQVIPMPSQHSFFTLNPCGKTQYGKLQFDWVRGHGEEKLLKVSSVKTKDTAHKVVDEL